MNRAFSPFVKSLFVALLAVSAAASANEEKKPAHAEAPVAKVDAAKGATLYADGDAARGLPACVSCHGAAGNSTISVNPKLAGLNAAYLHKQLLNFTTPERNNAVMSGFAKMLTDEEKKNIAAYLGAQVSKPNAAKNKDTVELGKRIYRGGIAEKSVPACASCHGASGAGMPIQYPRLGGQHQDYTAAQLTAFRAGARKNSPQMTTIAMRLSDDEIKAVADYVAGLK
ncbi:c-type cytochrome [Janthinobacterium fluminis]|uniref:C-type cytochrome n=1 Tax=Janthinobacterium fluminis TaxID=2987524 RepID=A0ABT5K5K4_9BURK|nr:c-type cytochrome [Janthinobacterium fluminis]MDC8760276.1 c-type cytochrome [Janthinobacterium fluminis]